MTAWLSEIKKSLKSWQDLAYSGYQMMRDYWSYDDIMNMPIKGLLDQIDFFTPKMKEIARQQEAARIEAELKGKKGRPRGHRK